MNQLELLSLLRFISNKKVIVFGTGKGSQIASAYLPCKVEYYVDNDPAKWDKTFGDSIIRNPLVLEDEDKDKAAILIMTSYYQEIAKQLSAMDFREHSHFINAFSLYRDVIANSQNGIPIGSNGSSIRLRTVGCPQKVNKVSIDASTIILPSAMVRFDVPEHIHTPAVTIGKDSMVGCNFIFESTAGCISIGERTFINAGVQLISRSSITIGNDVTIGWGCYLYDHDSHSSDWRERVLDIRRQVTDYQATGNMVLNKDWATVSSKPIVIQDKAWIGFDAVILKGVTIGEGAVVGAKSVVREDVEPWTVVVGNPAKVVKRLKLS